MWRTPWRARVGKVHHCNAPSAKGGRALSAWHPCRLERDGELTKIIEDSVSIGKRDIPLSHVLIAFVKWFPSIWAHNDVKRRWTRSPSEVSFLSNAFRVVFIAAVDLGAIVQVVKFKVRQHLISFSNHVNRRVRPYIVSSISILISYTDKIMLLAKKKHPTLTR
jgi:hypothetical protein